MNAPIEVQTIRDAQGRAAFAVVPFAEYQALLVQARAAKLRTEVLIPHEVVSLMVDGASAARAWREHLGLTQVEVATRMGISQAALAQMETATRPRKATREKLAEALGVAAEQLAIM